MMRRSVSVNIAFIDVFDLKNNHLIFLCVFVVHFKRRKVIFEVNTSFVPIFTSALSLKLAEI